MTIIRLRTWVARLWIGALSHRYVIPANPHKLKLESGEESGRRLLLGSAVIGRHQLDRRPRQDALVLVLPSLQHHLPEGVQIIDRDPPRP